MKLEEFAAELNRVSNMFQILAGIKKIAPNLEDDIITTSRQRAEKAFESLYLKWRRQQDEFGTTLY